MSLLFTYIDRNRVVMASDDRIIESLILSTCPKFQVWRTNTGRPIFFGASGKMNPIGALFHNTPRMLADTGMEFANLVDMMPGAVDHLLRRRKPEDIDPKRDVVNPPVMLNIAGFDPDAARMRAYAMLATGQGKCIARESAEIDLLCVGFLRPEDDEELGRFSDLIRRQGQSLSVNRIAELLACEMNCFAEKYPAVIGKASFFAAMDSRGLIQLPAEMALPWSVPEATKRARAAQGA